MGWLEGVLSGYADRHYAIQNEKRKEAELAAQREQQVLTALLESGVPEIQDHAAAGVLDLANPRRRSGGIAGWMGEMDKSPYLPMIQRARQRMADDPEYAEAQAKLAEERQGGYPATPSIPTPAGSVPNQPSAALPETSLVTGGPATAPTPAPPPAPPPPLGPLRPSPRYGEQGEFGDPDLFLRPGQGPAPFYANTPGAAPAGPYRPPPGGAPGPEPIGPYRPPPGGEPGPQPIGPYRPPAPPPAPPTPGVQAAQQAGAAPPQAGPPMAPAQGSPQGPPQPPAGPPLQVSGPPPPPAGQVSSGTPGAAVGQVGPGTPVPPSRTRIPNVFPTAADKARAKQQADIQGEVEGWQYLFRAKGDPDWQQKGIDAVLAQKRGSSGATLKEGNERQLPDGSWVQDLYDPYSGERVSTIPHPGPNTGGTVQTREGIAFRRYGNVGEDPRATIRRLTPTQYARVMEEEREEKALNVAATTLARARAMADAPLTRQAENQFIETLNSKWQKLQEPIRDTARSFEEMKIGLRQWKAGEKVASVEMVRVAFERILDPTSVVREGEYARQVLGLSAFQQLSGWWQRIKEGGGEIPMEQLEGMVETTRQFLEKMQGWNDLERGRIEDRAAANGVDPGYILGGGVRSPAPPPDRSAPDPKAAPGAGAPGAVNWNSPLRYDPVTRKMVPAN